MPKPWEMTAKQARAEGERLKERLEEADREDSWLFAKQLADLAEAEEKEEVQAEDESSATDDF